MALNASATATMRAEFGIAPPARRGERGGRDDRSTILGVPAHHRHLIVGEPARGVENFQRSRDLADIVDQSAPRDVNRVMFGEREPAR
jgi:hypothetical protein